MAERTRADSPTKQCTSEGCSRPLRARGLCITHYNQQNPNRHRKALVQCDCCGIECPKSSTSRYGKRYCTLLCRDLDSYPAECAVFDAHPSRSTSVPIWHPSREPADGWPRSRVAVRDCGWCGRVFVSHGSGSLPLTCSADCRDLRAADRVAAMRHRYRARKRAAYVTDVYRTQGVRA